MEAKEKSTLINQYAENIMNRAQQMMIAPPDVFNASAETAFQKIFDWAEQIIELENKP